jgi:hypothetical protein
MLREAMRPWQTQALVTNGEVGVNALRDTFGRMMPVKRTLLPLAILIFASCVFNPQPDPPGSDGETRGPFPPGSEDGAAHGTGGAGNAAKGATGTSGTTSASSGGTGSSGTGGSGSGGAGPVDGGPDGSDEDGGPDGSADDGGTSADSGM